MFGNYNCSNYPIPLYGNNVTSPIMCHFSIPQPWSPQQHGITRIYHIIPKYSKRNYVRNAMNIYIFRSLINPIGFVVVWFAIPRLYGAGLGFGSPNLNLNCFVIILIPKPPSNNTSSIVFFPIYTWIITIWLFIPTTTIPTFGTKEWTCLSMVTLLTFWVFSGFNFYQRYFFSSWAILSKCLKLKV